MLELSSEIRGKHIPRFIHHNATDYLGRMVKTDGGKVDKRAECAEADIARAVNDGHRKVLEHIGADEITYPEHDIGERLAFRLSHSSITDFVQFKGYKVVEIVVPEEWVGKDLITLNLRKAYGVNIIAVRYNDGRIDVSPSPTREFNAGEIVSIVGDDSDIEKMTGKIK